MGLIAPQVSIGRRPHLVACDGLVGEVPDGDGGYTEEFLPLDPPMLHVEIRPVTGADLQQLTDGAVMATTTHTITGPWHPGITTKSRLRFGSRIFRVTGIASPDERRVEGIMLCAETTK